MKKVYQAFDGKIFDDEDKCFEYEYLQSATDVELYDVDKHTGELYMLELTCENASKAPIVVIKTNGAAAWLQEHPWRSFPERIGVHVCYTIGHGWVEWMGTIDELQNDLRTRIPWQRYLDGLSQWIRDNNYSFPPHNPMSYDEWLSKEHSKEDNSNDR